MLDGLISTITHKLDRLKIWRDDLDRLELVEFLEDLKREAATAQEEWDSEYEHKDHSESAINVVEAELEEANNKIEELGNELKSINVVVSDYYERYGALHPHQPSAQP